MCSAIMHDDLPNVMALTIINRDPVTKHNKVLLGLRSANANNDHQNIVSAPSMKINAVVMKQISEWTKKIDSKKREALKNSGVDIVQDAVEYLMARKLGMASALEMGFLKFSYQPKLVKIGKNSLPKKLQRDDPVRSLQMANILVEIEKGENLFPLSSTSYSSLFWEDISTALVRINESLPFSIGGEDHYAGGLCICTSQILLERQLDTHPKPET